MKFKKDTIKPGMVIHCLKKEDAMALLEYLDELGYGNKNTILSPRRNLVNYCRIIDDIGYQWYCEAGKNTTITEFSDLIEPDEPQMNAVEVLEWLTKYRGKIEIKECFGRMYATDILFNQFTAEEIIQKITAYEAAKKAPKPVEVEYGYRCYVFVGEQTAYTAETEEYELWNVAEDEANDNVRAKAMEKTRETGKPTSTEVVFICRVKEDK